MAKIWIKNTLKTYKPNRAEIKKIVKTVLASENISIDSEFTICFVNDEAMRRYNKKYHNSDSTTDVLSFSLSGSPESILGEIIISFDTAKFNSRIFKTNPIREVNLYVIHGILHILGYDDLSPQDRKIMRKKENYYLSLLKL